MNDRKNFLIKHFGLRGVAIFEAAKGILGLAAAIWLLTLRNKDLTHVALRLLAALHIGPDRQLAQQILHAAGKMNNHFLWFLVLTALIYMIVRFVEAGGLWLEKEWAEWFAVLSGSLYLPVELYAIVRHANALKWAIFLANIVVVLYMAWLLRDSYKRRKLMAAEKPAD